MDDSNQTRHFVVVGASAGGINALPLFVAGLPADFPAPILIAQHLAPDRESHLGEILSKHSKLPIQTVRAETDLEPGTIYVVPANRNIEVTGRQVRLIEAGPKRPYPSIDRLLSSAAQVYGEQLIAVILSGTGSDGAAGARKVNEADGTIIVQNPKTAEFPDMPQSFPTSIVDFVADIEEIGPLVYQIVTTPPSAVADQEANGITLESFLEQLRIQCNINFSHYKPPTITRRLQRRLIATNTKTLSEYAQYLRDNPEEYRHLINSLLIKVTKFFRDPEPFEYLKTEILPEIIEEGRKRGNQIRIWSAGCATGEEAYSLAILIAELLGDELERFNVRIFATDLDEHAVAYARRGVYPAAVLNDVPEEFIERYFISGDGEYAVSKRIRGLVIFGEHDLGQRSPFPRIDLIFCRNVLIYFTGDLQHRALLLFAFSLRNGGYLVLGKSESTRPISELFTVENQRMCIYKRQGDRAHIPSTRIDTRIPSMPQSSALPMVWKGHSTFESVRDRAESQQHARVAVEKTENLLFHLPVGVVVVDRDYDILSINSAARRLLRIHGAAVGEDLIHLVHNMPLEPLRDSIDRVFRLQRRERLDEPVRISTANGEEHVVEVACSPYEVSSNNTSSAVVIVTIAEVNTRGKEEQSIDAELTRESTDRIALSRRAEQLANTQQELLDANEQLALANDELRSNNERFQVAYEEAQSSAEEIETLNEELQATNEELETLNEELQATVEELHATNEDMHARTMELQETALSLENERRLSEEERARLEAMLVSMSDAVMVIDAEGNAILKNAACEQLFGADLSNLKPKNADGTPLPSDKHPVCRAAAGEYFHMQFSITESDGGARRWLDAIGQPIRGDGVYSGNVVVIRDITEQSLRRLQEEFMSIASHELRSPLTALRGYLEMLQRHLSSEDERSQRYITVTLAMVDRLTALVNDLLEVGRLQSGKFQLSLESTDLTALVRQTVEIAQALTTTHTVYMEAHDEPLKITADPMRIQQVVWNLLTNAITYSPEADRIDVRLAHEGNEAVVLVQDYGVGMSEAVMPQIFSRFFQIEHADPAKQPTSPWARGRRGLGLGLYIAKAIVRSHGGQIEVESVEDEGTTFTVRLPLDARQVHETSNAIRGSHDDSEN